MLMRRSDFAANIAVGICDATAGLWLWSQALEGPSEGPWIWVLSVSVGSFAVSFGFALIRDAAQSLEVDEKFIIYQNVWSVKRIEWTDIDAYILEGDRFIAIDTAHYRILLDINMRGDDKQAWPVQECAQIRQWIQRKMNETGAIQESTLSLHNNHGINIKP